MELKFDHYQRVVVITGNFGSGKSEQAINLALQGNSSGIGSIALVDLDLAAPWKNGGTIC